MGDNFYSAYTQAVPEPKALGMMGGSLLLLARRR
jgi:hypothetical protein